MIRAVNVSIMLLSSHTCADLVALLLPARKAGRDRHPRTLLAHLFAWLVLSGKVQLAGRPDLYDRITESLRLEKDP